ncbi:MAG TPA: phosphomannomutase/phosphoglucomutase [Phycisphaerae bacterium]|nr:phosphomannomutase/phosphoglucomutase [Phycisphaerae bacterium]
MAKLDRVFKAYDVRGIYAEEVDEDLAWKIGHASGAFLRSLMSGYERGQASSNRLVVGRDMRPSSEPLAKALIEGITSSGAGCIDIGMCDTPMVYFAVNHLATCGGIQVTASHNPMEYNGFKISGAKARPIGQDTGLKEVKRLVSTLRRMPRGASVGPCQGVDLWDEYRRHVLRFLKAARRLKVVVDASNAMGGKMMPTVFGEANIEIVPLNFEMSGTFAHPPNPLVESNLQQLQQAVVKNKADMGICLDGDADRCMFVDENGRIVRCDIMTALFAPHFLKDSPGSMIPYDLRSSRVVAEEVRAAGGVPRRERVGHAFMKKTMADNHCVFGGELSGHFYFRDNFNCDSGAIAFATAVTVLSAREEPFSEVVAPLQRYAHSGEINFEVDDKAAKMKEVEAAFTDAEIDHLDGVTCSYKDWWVNVRPSNTEPLLRLSIEAPDPAALNSRVAQLEKILGKPVDH